ncbi:hypothetical protein [Streptomyces sp. NPDC048350]|uniref:hypothetical protein n=1 Tax=Streptomyces sp. NPDC048350 TaxID=3365538 RepID=UPI00370FF6B2
MRSHLIGRTPAAPAPHPLRRVTDWPSAESRRRRPRVPAHRPASHPGRRATDRLRATVRTCRSAVRRPRTTARRRRSRTVRARAASNRRGSGSSHGSPSESAGHSGAAGHAPPTTPAASAGHARIAPHRALSGLPRESAGPRVAALGDGPGPERPGTRRSRRTASGLSVDTRRMTPGPEATERPPRRGPRTTYASGRDPGDGFRLLHGCDEVQTPEALRRLDVREATVSLAGGRGVLVGTPSPPREIRP